MREIFFIIFLILCYYVYASSYIEKFERMHFPLRRSTVKVALATSFLMNYWRNYYQRSPIILVIIKSSAHSRDSYAYIPLYIPPNLLAKVVVGLPARWWLAQVMFTSISPFSTQSSTVHICNVLCYASIFRGDVP